MGLCVIEVNRQITNYTRKRDGFENSSFIEKSIC